MYKVPPRWLRGFPDARPVRPKGGGKKKRKRWRDSKTGDFIEWDYQHGRVERYNDRGKHLGEFDPDSGMQTKPADPSRTITPTISSGNEVPMVFYLTWFEKDGDGYVGESLIPNVRVNEVRKAFSLKPREYPGDCLDVGEQHLKWLNKVVKGVFIDLDSFTYFVEVCQH